MKTFKILFLFLIILILKLGEHLVVARELTQEERILKQTILYKAGSNYLQKVYATNRIMRWNKAYFPIKVYVENNPDAPNYYAYSFVKAAKIWELETGGVVKVDFTRDEKNANILFKVIKRPAPIRPVSPNESVTLAYTQASFTRDKLLKQTIYFYERNSQNKLSPPYEVLNIAVHEFGHALGISGHSDDPNSIMYAFYDPKKEKHTSFLNKQDKSTLNLLYMVTPDITNGNKALERGTISADILVGSVEERTQSSLEIAKKEAATKQGDCNSMLRIAAIYQEKQDLENMFLAIQEAQKRAKTKTELYGVHVGYAYYYYYKRDKQNAKAHILKALELNYNDNAKQFLYYIEKL